VIRYENQPLPQRPRIAVVANDAIGNFVMATPVLQLLRRERTPASIDYFGGTRTQELQEASDLIETSHLLHGASPSQFVKMMTIERPYDLVVNFESTPLSKVAAGLLSHPETLVAGPCIGPGGRGELEFSSDARGDLWRDRGWAGEGLTAAYPFLRSGFISEIFSRLLYLEGELPPYQVPCSEPRIEIPDVLIATAASLPEKLWGPAKWRELIVTIRESGRSVGLLGAAPASQNTLWVGGEAESELLGPALAVDLRGQLSLPEVVGAIRRAKAVVTLDNGILHLAVAAQTPTVGLYRRGIERLWAPPFDQLSIILSPPGGFVDQIPVGQVAESLEHWLG